MAVECKRGGKYLLPMEERKGRVRETAPGRGMVRELTHAGFQRNGIKRRKKNGRLAEESSRNCRIQGARGL